MRNDANDGGNFQTFNGKSVFLSFVGATFASSPLSYYRSFGAFDLSGFRATFFAVERPGRPVDESGKTGKINKIKINGEIYEVKK